MEQPEPVRKLTDVSHRRIAAYLSVGAGLTLSYAALRGTTWHGGATLHTVMEAVATLLALTVGAMALVRFYSKKNNTFLFVGAGFLGTAFLDGYHAVVTSAAFKPFMPSDLPYLIPWSWVASRQFLSVFLFLSWLAWLREHRLGDAGRISQRSVYLFAGLFTLISFVFFAFAPLPRAYYPELAFHRPEELLPALFFIAALVGYLQKGDWRHDHFEHWLVLSLIVGFIGQTVFMSFSGALFDMEFDAAHLLKKVSYVCVLTGLLVSMYEVLRLEEERGEAVAKAKEKAEAALTELASHKQALDEHAIVGVTDTKGTIIYANDNFCQISGYSREELIGQNHRVLNSGHHPQSFFTDLYGTIANGKAWHGEIKNHAKDGSHYWVDTTIAPFKDANGKIVQYIGIRTDITERKQAENELLRHRDRLQELVDKATVDLQTKAEELKRALGKEQKLNEMQRQFISTASHEFRTPLTVIDTLVQLMIRRKDELTPDDLETRGNKIRTAVKTMTMLMESTLSAARMDAGKIEINIVPCNLRGVVTEVCAQQTEFSQKHSLVCDLDALPDGISADAGALEQIFTNIVSNAVKYSPDSPEIMIKGWREGNDAVVSVQDRGLGMDEDDLPKMFARFFRARTSIGITGTGIGLNLVKTLVELHGGSISVESKKDEGSTFTVRLPIAGPPVSEREQENASAA